MKLFQKNTQAFYSTANICDSFKYCVEGFLLQKCSWASKVCSSVCQKAVVPRLNYRKKKLYK